MLADFTTLNPNAMTALLSMPYKYNLSVENIAEVTNLVLHMLKHETLQQLLLETNFQRFMTFFLNTYSTEIRDASFAPLASMNEQGKSAEDIAISIETRTTLIKAFAGTALRCEDIERIRTELSELVHWLRALEPQIQVCACLFLGNLACNSSHFGEQVVCLPQFESLLIHCLNTTQRSEVLGSAFDLLQNLAVEPGNREKLGEAGLLQALARCWSPRVVDLQSCRRALYHTRQLIYGSLSNVYLFLRRNDAPVPSSPDNQRLIYQLLLAFEQTKDPTSKAEVGRILAEVWRTLSRSSQSQKVLEFSASPLVQIKAENVSDKLSAQKYLPRLVAQTIRETFLDEARFQLIKPILNLIRSDNESLVTEGWLTLSLMAMWKEGALIIYERLCMDGESSLDLLQNTVEAQNSRSGAYANARYLVAQLSKQLVSLEQAHGEITYLYCQGNNSEHQAMLAKLENQLLPPTNGKS